jgi:hypothetical protein
MLKLTQRTRLGILFVVAGFMLACLSTPSPAPTIDVNQLVTQTFAALTANAPTATVAPLEPSLTPTVVLTDIPTVPVDATAPSPLPVTHTGIILNAGDCFDFDTGAVTPLNASCDMYMAEGALIRQTNGAQISGYVTFEPPSRSDCIAGRYEPGDLAAQTDLYMCFKSNNGGTGFVVVREYRPGIPIPGIVVDYWLFP